MQAGPRIGTILLLGTGILSGLLAWGGQRLLLRSEPLTPDWPSSRLWRTYRWSIDPQRRREAALLMDSGNASPDLLRGQGWGRDPLAAVVLERSAEAADPDAAISIWRQLLKRFPGSVSSASARLVLGDQSPELHQQLLDQHPGHPAALKLAAAMEPSLAQGHRGALHLASWGPRSAGAFKSLLRACEDTGASRPDPLQRQQLARSLALLGDADSAQQCLQGAAMEPDTQLAIGRSLSSAGREEEGTELLVALARQHPQHPASAVAARLLSEPLRPDPAVLDALPEVLQRNSASVAAARVRLADGTGALEVMNRWPDDPDIWQLQWDLARNALLKQRWGRVQALLERDPGLRPLPGPLEARRLFWLGLSLEKQGDLKAAERVWRRLIATAPPGYYSWRAKDRLQEAPPLNLRQLSETPASRPWTALNSANPLVNTLWRLGLTEQAWAAWRSQQHPRKPPSRQEQLVEGRLRLAIGDSWTGLDRLWRLSLRWRSPDCMQKRELLRSQKPLLFMDAMAAAANSHQVRLELLQAISKQESRFASGVSSPAGAIGLMQLMPATAEEMAAEPLTEEMLKEPERNIRLGAAYLDQLIDLWNGDPFRSIASYNAGPGAVASWPEPRADEDPALWVERIPYPETRYYTKKVIDNLLGYSGVDQNLCEPAGSGIRQQMADPDSSEHHKGQ